MRESVARQGVWVLWALMGLFAVWMGVAYVQRSRKTEEAHALLESKPQPIVKKDAFIGRSPPAQPCVSINQASFDELRKLPRMSRALANRIIQMRPYRRTTEVLGVKGVGQTRWQSWRPWLCMLP